MAAAAVGRSLPSSLSRRQLQSHLHGILGGGALRPFASVHMQKSKLLESGSPGEGIVDRRRNAVKRGLLDHRGRTRLEGRQTQEQIEDARRIMELKRQGDWSGAVAALRALEAPNHFQYATALDACTQALQPEQAWELWNQLPESSHMPAKVGVYNMMIKMCRRLKELGEAKQLYEDLRRKGLEPTIITYSEMIQAYGMHGLWEEARELLREVVSLPMWADCRPVSKQIVYLGALTACSRKGRYQEAREVLAEMQREGVPVQHCHYNALMSACINDSDSSTAAQVFDEMRAAGLEPRVEDYTARMSCSRDDLQACEAFFAELRQRGLQPRRLTFEAIAQAALQAGAVDRAKELLAEARECCTMPPSRKTLELEDRAAGQVEAPPATMAMGSLPEGWDTAKCPSSGLPYYWRQADPSGTVTWERPR